MGFGRPSLKLCLYLYLLQWLYSTNTIKLSLNIVSFYTARTLSPKQKLALIDKMMACAAVIHPLTTAPQVYMIYTTQNVAGISIWTWIGFTVLGLVFLAYGLAHHIRPYIVMQVLWLIVDILVVAGILLYR